MDTSELIPNGPVRTLYRGIQPLAEATFGFSALRRMYDECIQAPHEPVALAQSALDYLGVDVDLDESGCERLGEVEGPLILAANHPFGGIEFFALVALMEKLRPGAWKFLANDLLCSIPGFGESLIPLDPLARRPETRRRNQRGLEECMKFLRDGGLLGLFPAGRVSCRHAELNGAVADAGWSPHLLRLAARTGATVACLHIPGRNSRCFLRIPFAWPRLRALALCRELTSPNTDKVCIRLAGVFSPREVGAMACDAGASDRLRAICYLRADLDVPRPVLAGNGAVMRSLKEPPARNEISDELAELAVRSQALIGTYGKFDLYWFQGKAAPHTMQSLGIAREATFRKAGQGTGEPCDLSEEDGYYHHLILWDRSAHRLAGAYRLGVVQEILDTIGPEGLYLSHVFHIKQKLYERMGQAFELSRSFVLPEYQRDSQALAGLWRGLGMAARRYQADTFFGSVTISNHHHPATRAILVEYLRQNHADNPEIQNLVRARNPFEPLTRYHRWVAAAYKGEAIGKLGGIVDQIENGQRGIPPLIRYYCGIGGKFIGFHVEPSFQDAVYCLLRVNISQIPESYKKHFMPAEDVLN